MPLQELQRKGVSKEVCRSVLERTFGEGNNSGIQFRDEREGIIDQASIADWDRLDHDTGRFPAHQIANTQCQIRSFLKATKVVKHVAWSRPFTS